MLEGGWITFTNELSFETQFSWSTFLKSSMTSIICSSWALCSYRSQFKGPFLPLFIGSPETVMFPAMWSVILRINSLGPQLATSTQPSTLHPTVCKSHYRQFVIYIYESSGEQENVVESISFSLLDRPILPCFLWYPQSCSPPSSPSTLWELFPPSKPEMKAMKSFSLLRVTFFLLLASELALSKEHEAPLVQVCKRQHQHEQSPSTSLLHRMPSWCFQPSRSPLQRSHPAKDIDSRYGVGKQLIPSGPNPLHNWRADVCLFITSCGSFHLPRRK